MIKYPNQTYNSYKKKKNVSFNETVNIIYEPDHLSEDLQMARISDYMQRQRTKYFFEMLMTPVFESNHCLVAQMRQLNLNL